MPTSVILVPVQPAPVQIPTTPPMLPSSTGDAAIASPAPAAKAKSSPHLALIEQNKKAALKRTAKQQAEAEDAAHHVAIFEQPQWL